MVVDPDAGRIAARLGDPQPARGDAARVQDPTRTRGPQGVPFATSSIACASSEKRCPGDHRPEDSRWIISSSCCRPATTRPSSARGKAPKAVGLGAADDDLGVAGTPLEEALDAIALALHRGRAGRASAVRRKGCRCRIYEEAARLAPPRPGHAVVSQALRASAGHVRRCSADPGRPSLACSWRRRLERARARPSSNLRSPFCLAAQFRSGRSFASVDAADPGDLACTVSTRAGRSATSSSYAEMSDERRARYIGRPAADHAEQGRQPTRDPRAGVRRGWTDRSTGNVVSGRRQSTIDEAGRRAPGPIFYTATICRAKFCMGDLADYAPCRRRGGSSRCAPRDARLTRGPPCWRAAPAVQRRQACYRRDLVVQRGRARLAGDKVTSP